jgi:eukaryotic-like serine/threonine-protein kinase
MPPDVDLLSPKYRVVGLIGRGGMGLVYEVERRADGSRWAAKVLAYELRDRRDLVKRMQLEAEALGRLRHPNLVRVVETGASASGRVYYVMNLLRGRTLRHALSDDVAYAPARASGLVLQLLAGLGAAHAVGLIHRDVKPENVFLCEGGLVKLLDFGIAKNLYAVPAGAPLTPASGPGVVGTLRYAAPECIEGGHATPLSDVYSAGAVFWELLTGQLPFHFESRFQMFSAIVHQGFPPLGRVRPGLPAELCALVGRATARDPGARFPSIAAFAEATRRTLERLPADPPEPARPRSSRRQAVATRAPFPDEARPAATVLRSSSRLRAAPQDDTETAPPDGAAADERRRRGRLLERLQPRQGDKVFLDVEELARRNPDWADALLAARASGDGVSDKGDQR